MKSIEHLELELAKLRKELEGKNHILKQMQFEKNALEEKIELLLSTELENKETENSDTIRFETLLNRMTKGVVFQDTTGKIIRHNRAAEKILGLSTDQITGRTSFDQQWKAIRENGSAFPGEDHPAMVTLTTGKALSDIVMGVFRPDTQTYTWLLVNSTPIFKAGETVPHEVLTTFEDITHRKFLESTIDTHNEKLKAIIESIPGKIFEHDQDGNFVGFYVRDPDKMLAPQEKLVGMNLADIFEPEAAEINLKSIRESLSDNKLVIHEFSHFHDGKLHYYEVSTVPINNHRVIRFTRDITDKKENELELKKLKIAIEQSPVMLVITNPRGEMEYVSPAFTQITGYDWEDVIGKHTRMLKSGENPKEMYEDLWLSIIRGERWYGVWINLKKNGEKYWENIIISPVTDDKGNIIHFIAIKEDITERKLAEDKILELNAGLEDKVRERTAELSASNERLIAETEERKRIEEELKAKTKELEKFFTVSLEMLCITSLQGDFLKVNNAFQDILGYSPEYFEKRNFSDFLHPDDVKSTSRIVANLGVSEKILGYTNRYRHKNGSYRNIEWHVVKVGDHLYAAARDVTERIIFEESLQANIAKEKELNELKSRFVSMASHEFRTPLSTILMVSETLLNYWKKMDEAKIQAKLNTMIFQIKHLNDIVSNVLQVSKIQEGRIPFNPQETEVVSFIQNAISPFNSDKKLKRNIEFRSEFESLTIFMDCQLMLQVMNNLLSNAIKYSQPDPGVLVRLYKDDRKIMISVRDNGIGIPKDDLPRMFEPFFRAGNVTKIDGNGLGLTIVRECVVLHGGNISVTSEQNLGSTFLIELPEELIISE
ncbi:protein containing PAS domain S-box [Bacteroidales bacterium 6E]|nr:protein containing PAS domain S-box [Bacteroidales bacterium 6E]